MSNSLLGCRHHGVVSCNDDNGDISHLCTTGTHSSKGFVSRSIKECHLLPILQCNAVCTDMLCNTTGFTCNYIGISDMIEQRSLTVVDVSHHRYNRCTRYKIVLVVNIFTDSFLHFCTDIFGLETEFICHHINGFGIKSLVYGNHDAYTHQRRNNLCHADIHHRGQLADGNKLRKFQYFCFFTLCIGFLLKLLLHSFALLFTIFRAFLVLALTCQSGQSFFHLACYSLIVYL